MEKTEEMTTYAFDKTKFPSGSSLLNFTTIELGSSLPEKLKEKWKLPFSE